MMYEKIKNENTSQKFNWKQQEVQLLQWMNFRWKTFKIVTSMKKRSTRKSCMFTVAFQRYVIRSIPVSGWRTTNSGWRATRKKSHEKQSEVQVHAPSSSGSLHGAFSKNLFRNKGRTHDPAVFKITWKWSGFRENHQHEKVSHFL